MTKRLTIYSFLLITFTLTTVVVLSTLNSYSQSKDFGAWTTLSLDKKLNGKFSASLSEELRFFHNLQRYNLSYTNLGVSYKLTKSVKFAVVYRFLQKYQDQNTISWRHRLYVDAQFKQKYYPITVVYRARLQSQVRDYYTSRDGKFPEKYWRNKFDVRYEIGKGFSPYLAAEFRYQFMNDRNKSANNKFNRGRYYVGCQYQHSDSKTIDFYFMHQREFNVNNPERNYILGIEYAYSF